MVDELVVTDDVPGEFADRFVEAYHARPGDGFAIALSGGETARTCYQRLAESAATEVDWWAVDVYWAWERCAAAGATGPNATMARRALLEVVGAANATYPLACGDAIDDYQLRLANLVALDLVHLDLAPDGGVGGLTPADPGSGADPGRLVAISADGTSAALTPTALSRSHLIVITAVGGACADALAAARSGDPALPTSGLHPARLVWMADEGAMGAAG